MKHYMATAFALAALLALSGALYAADLSVELTRSSKKWLTFKGSAKGGGSASDERLTLTAAPEAAGYRLQLGGKEYRVKIKDQSYKVNAPNGKLLFKIKRKEGKVKVMRTEDDKNAWSISTKGGKESFKVKKGEREIGKCAYYKDKKQVKAKNAKGEVLCTARSSGPLMSPAVALFDGIADRDMLVLFTMLCLLDAGL